MEEKSFTKKPFAKKPYRVDAKALESKGFEMIRYDRHESYAKEYALEGRVFVGAVNPVTGDRSVIKEGAFASAKDIDLLREAWDALSADVLGPRPEKAPAPAAKPLPEGTYSYSDLTSTNGAPAEPAILTADEVEAALGASGTWAETVSASSAAAPKEGPAPKGE